MSIRFFESVMGKRFYEGTLPKAVRAIERLADRIGEVAHQIERTRLSATAEAEDSRLLAVIDLDPNRLEAIGEHGDRRDRLLGTLLIDGVSHHLELLEVGMMDDHIQRAKYEEHQEILSRHGEGGDGPFVTIALRGRDYVAFMEPFCS